MRPLRACCQLNAIHIQSVLYTYHKHVDTHTHLYTYTHTYYMNVHIYIYMANTHTIQINTNCISYLPLPLRPPLTPWPNFQPVHQPAAGSRRRNVATPRPPPCNICIGDRQVNICMGDRQVTKWPTRLKIDKGVWWWALMGPTYHGFERIHPILIACSSACESSNAQRSWYRKLTSNCSSCTLAFLTLSLTQIALWELCIEP